jgi:hypothetical protein
MKPQATGIRRASTFDGQRIDLSIDTNSLAHIMSVLTNLYSDPEMAVLREYSCNARDSHLASGNTQPIEIVLPSPINPTLSIRDYGVGLSLDELTNLFSRYGASTKRDSDTQTGMLGLGSKSALTYAPSFTMTAVKDGVKSEVLVSVKVDGAGTMTVMDTCSTNEHNGVTITIPTKPDNKFEEKAKELFSVWESGSVLVNGEVPDPIVGMSVGDLGVVRKGSGYAYDRKHLVVMGGVPYPLSSDYRDKINAITYGSEIVLFAPMGAVDFVPSREELHFTPRTHASVEQLIANFADELSRQITDELVECDTPAQAMAVANRWRSLGVFVSGGNSPYVFRGQKIPTYFDGSHHFYNPTRSWTSRKWSREHRDNSEVLNDAVFVYDYQPESAPSPVIRERVAQWLADNGHANREMLLFAPTNFIGEWSSAISVDYATIKATKLPKSTSAQVAKRTPAENFDWVQHTGYTNSTSLDLISGDVAYYSVTDLDNYYAKSDARTFLHAIVSQLDYTLVEVNKNRQTKFVREYENGNAVALLDLLPQIFQAKYDALTDRELALGNYKTGTNLSQLVLASINDEKLLREMADQNTCENKVDKIYDLVSRTYHRVFGMGAKPHTLGLRDSDYELALDSYPLLSFTYLQNKPEAVVEYVNALYAIKGGEAS